MIQAFHLHKRYPNNDAPALSDVSFDLAKGEFAFLTGPSGAGKSTLLKLILAAQRPTRGQLLVNGNNISRLDRKAVAHLRRSIGTVFQDFKLLPRRTVEANVAVTLEILELPGHEIRRKVYETLKRVGLAHKLHQYPERLSGGEQQRVAIARALINEPLIVLADEPTGSLDSERSEETIAYLREANARGTTVLVATHDQGLLESTSHRVLELREGRLVRA